MAAETAAPARPSFTRTIYLVRHGLNETSQKVDPAIGPGLAPLGVVQARLIATRLRGLPITFTSLTSSTMTRARQTAQIIGESFPQLPLANTPLLSECTPRTWNEEIMKNEKPAKLDAAEAQLNEAFAKFFVAATERDENDLLVCHANVIRYFVTKALGVDTKAWRNFFLANCSLTIIQVTPTGVFRVLAVGDVGHIPLTLQSGLTPTEPRLAAPELTPR